jgi:hypothetical protein
MAKKKLSFEVLILLLSLALFFAAVSNIGWIRFSGQIIRWLFILGIIFFVIASGIYIYLYLNKKIVATTLKKNSSSLRNIAVIVLAVAYVTAMVISVVLLVIAIVSMFV